MVYFSAYYPLRPIDLIAGLPQSYFCRVFPSLINGLGLDFKLHFFVLITSPFS